MKLRLGALVALASLPLGWVLLAQETAASASDDGPFEAIGQLIGKAVLAHPGIAGALVAAVLVAVFTVSGLRMAWPTKTDRPRAVRFVLGVLDPLALNFWDAATWLVARLGFKLRPLPEDAKSAETRAREGTDAG